MAKLNDIKEFFEFLTASKKWWLFPIAIFLLLIGAMLIYTEGSAITPLIYAMF